MAIVCVGVDLAKNVFAIHGVDEVGKAVWVQARVPRAQLLAAFSNLPPCLIGREACSGAHHWARQLLAMGHKVRLIAPKFVTPYRLGGKRGANTTPPMPPPFVKPCNGHICALCRSNQLSNRRGWRSTTYVNNNLGRGSVSPH